MPCPGICVQPNRSADPDLPFSTDYSFLNKQQNGMSPLRQPPGQQQRTAQPLEVAAGIKGSDSFWNKAGGRD